MLSSKELRQLYPEIEPFRSGRLRVSRIHELYFDESGNPDGKPVVFIHGGPGSGTSSKQRRYFDPQNYRILLLDQRGSGRSAPHACLDENTTWHLVEDLEIFRKHLGIKRWQLFGGSWGSALALAYAERYPDRVTECILRGIFMLRKKEIRWFYQEGANAIFPDAWEDYLSPIPEHERHDLVSAYYRRLTGENMEERVVAAKAWSRWETSTSFLVPQRDYIERADDEQFSLAFARIECHYFMNGGFFDPEDQLLKNLHRLRQIPCIIVQGRYDLVCPMQTAWELHRAWPEADFRIVPIAGHSAYESSIIHELVSATDQFR